MTELSKKSFWKLRAASAEGRAAAPDSPVRCAAGVAVGNAWVPVVTPAAGLAGFAGLGLAGENVILGLLLDSPLQKLNALGLG